MKVIILVFLIFLPICASLSLSFENKEITWAVFHRPAWFILKGPYTGKGYGDILQKVWMNSLKSYKHKSLKMNIARLGAYLKEDRNLCIASLSKVAFFSKHISYSKPFYALQNYRIYMLKKTYDLLGQPKILSMNALLKNKEFIYANIKGSNPPVSVKDLRDQKNIRTISGSSSVESIIKMLQFERVHWFVEFPIIFNWSHINSKNKESINQFVSIPIKEQKEPYIKGRLACTKSPWGNEIIKKINGSINKEMILDYRSELKVWIPNKTDWKEFLKINKELLGY